MEKLLVWGLREGTVVWVPPVTCPIGIGIGIGMRSRRLALALAFAFACWLLNLRWQPVLWGALICVPSHLSHPPHPITLSTFPFSVDSSCPTPNNIPSSLYIYPSTFFSISLVFQFLFRLPPILPSTHYLILSIIKESGVEASNITVKTCRFGQ